ncbi:dehydration-responsive element-binding protein 1E-like [Curcuma longa]|uniref:dehydration-responsive element-binding protein 1E-like n=1 Tax=Curcuma longa TaxID=136217 RepID=UPI003D9F3641
MEGFNSGFNSDSGSPSAGETWDYETVSSAPPKRPAGRTKFRETRHPVYKGVRRRGTAGRWVCEVREPNKKSRIWLGTFPTADMAARAHDVAAMMLRGRAACLNFADSAWLIQVPSSFSGPRDIARAAAEAAEQFRPRASSSSANSPSATAPSPTFSTAATTPSPEEATPTASAFDLMSYEDMDLGYSYYAGMADELLVAPPLHGGYNWDDLETCADVPLWSYSI